MTIHTLERPDTLPELTDWLERHLVGNTLGELVAELKAISDANVPDPPLVELVSLESVLQDGLKTQSEDKIRKLFRHPKRLSELQERILIDGGVYWDQVPRSDEVIKSSQRVFDRLQESIHIKTSPAQILLKSRPEIQRWLVSSAALFLIGLAIGWMVPHGNSHAEMAWTKAEAFRPAANRQEFLNRLATLANDWFAEKATTPDQLASKIIEFRRGCTQLQLHADAIPAEDRKWLLEDCRKWSDKLDQQLKQVEDRVVSNSGPDLEEIRVETDATIQKLIEKLETKANA